MIEPGKSWRVRLTDAAETDVGLIIQWTEERFGQRQAETYMDVLSAAFDDLAEGPGCPGARSRGEVRPGFFTLHVSRHGRRGRHFILFRVIHEQVEPVIEVLRVLHDAMDLRRHLPDIEPKEN